MLRGSRGGHRPELRREQRAWRWMRRDPEPVGGVAGEFGAIPVDMGVFGAVGAAALEVLRLAAHPFRVG
jgi:hypothetical protein